MATRFYLPASGSAPISVTPAAYWDLTTSYIARPTGTTKSNTALAAGTARANTGSLPSSTLDVQFVSGPLTAQTISGTLSMVLMGLESFTSANAWLDVVVRVVSGDGVLERGVLWAGSPNDTESSSGGAENEEFSLSNETRIKNAVTLSSVDASSGDRVVIEVGARYATTNTARTTTRRYGDPSAGTDYALTSGLTSTTGVPWVEFSATLAFSTPGVFAGSRAGGAGDGSDGVFLSNAPVTLVGSPAAAGSGRAATGQPSASSAASTGSSAAASGRARDGVMVGVRNVTMAGGRAYGSGGAAKGLPHSQPADIFDAQAVAHLDVSEVDIVGSVATLIVHLSVPGLAP